MKRFSMLNMAGGAVYPRLFEVDGAVDADDRAFLLRLYGGNPFQIPVRIVERRVVLVPLDVRDFRVPLDKRRFLVERV